MVKKLKHKLFKRKSLTLSHRRRIFFVEAFFIAFILLVFDLKISNYVHWTALEPQNLGQTVKDVSRTVSIELSKSTWFGTCHTSGSMRPISGGYVCREAEAPSSNLTIYDTYPRVGTARYQLKPISVTQSNVANLLQDKIVYEGKTYSTKNGVPWSAGTDGSKQWGEYLYDLDFLQDLTNETAQSNDPVAGRKLISLTRDYLTNGSPQNGPWSSNYIVARRTTNLINIWWKLRDAELLDSATSSMILDALDKQGAYLTDQNHYDPQLNDGVAEALSLIQLGTSFPTMPNAQTLTDIGTQRLVDGYTNSLDPQGAPYFRAPNDAVRLLTNYWDIYKYTKRNNVNLGTEYFDDLHKSLQYITYVLQPNMHGLSIESYYSSNFQLNTDLKELCALDPGFAYVFTHGKSGHKPSQLNQQFTDAGQVALRTSWDDKGLNEQQSQLVMNTGSSVRRQLAFDRLSINLYGANEPLILDSSLYSPDKGNLSTDFASTAAHNTVMVDHANQAPGAATMNTLTQQGNIQTASASFKTTPDTTQQRVISTLDSRHYLITDTLTSTSTHTYDQLFHLTPGAVVVQTGDETIVKTKSGRQLLSIKQLNVSSASAKAALQHSLCSLSFQQTVSCDTASYEQTGKTATFVTLISVGRPTNLKAAYDATAAATHVTSGRSSYNLKYSSRPGSPTAFTSTHPSVRPKQLTTLLPMGTANDWTFQGTGSISDDKFTPADYSTAQPSSAITVTLPPFSKTVVSKAVSMNLSNGSLMLQLKTMGIASINNLSLVLLDSNGNEAKSSLREAYPNQYDGQWVNVSLPKSSQRNVGGRWILGGTNFDWKHVANLSIHMETPASPTATVSFAQIGVEPAQSKGSVVIVFDDGYSSIMPGAEILKKYGLKANVAVIGKYVKSPHKGYLTLQQLNQLRKNFGWNTVNHSFYHAIGVTTYSTPNRLDAYAEDIAKGAGFLITNGMNDAPNWFIYPHGSEDENLKNVLAKYYPFARSVINEPETYPFADPLGVKTLSIHNSNLPDESTTASNTPSFNTDPDTVNRAIQDAKKYNTTLFLTFHRLYSGKSDRPGYPIQQFEQVAKDIHQSGLPALTLSELDKANGIPETNQHYQAATSPEIDADITITSSRTSLWDNIVSEISNL